MKLLLLRPHSQIPAAPPPIGLAYLAAYLRKNNTNCEIDIFDGRLKEASLSQFKEAILASQPDVVGITAFSMEAKEAHALANLVKEIRPETPVILGGPYPSSDANNAGSDDRIDFLVFGEGELTLKLLLDALNQHLEFSGVKGIGYRRNGELISTGPGNIIPNPDDIPFPAWELINLEEYFHPSASKRRLTNPIQMKNRGVSVFSSRGCPYQCTYCHNIFGKKLRSRSPENVIEELKWLKREFEVEEVEFIDDVFNLDLARAKRIMDLMIEADLKMKFSFPNGLRADRMDEELVMKMKRAGCYRINYAIESGSDIIQRRMKKRLNLKRAQEVINFTANQGISVGGFFMLGFPDETEEQMKQTINFALKSRCHTASFFILTPFPGTEMYAQAQSAGYDMNAFYSDYGAVSANLSRDLSSEKILKLRRNAFRRFYFNPRRIISIIRTTPNKLALIRNFLRTVRLSFLGKEY